MSGFSIVDKNLSLYPSIIFFLLYFISKTFHGRIILDIFPIGIFNFGASKSSHSENFAKPCSLPNL
jgi:hypothetical protein